MEEDLTYRNDSTMPIVGRDVTGRPMYIQKPGQTLLEAYEDAVYGPNWRETQTAQEVHSDERHEVYYTQFQIATMPIEQLRYIRGNNVNDRPASEIAHEWATKNKMVIVPANTLVISSMVQKDYAFFERNSGEQEDLDAAVEDVLPGDVFRKFIEANEQYFRSREHVTLIEILMLYKNWHAYPDNNDPRGNLSQEEIDQLALRHWANRSLSTSNDPNAVFSKFQG